MRIALRRCVVRSWEPTDAPAVAVHANCREVWINLRDAFPHPYTEDDAHGYIRACRDRRPETNFAIEVEGQAAGSVGLQLGEDVERASAEVGYWLGQRFWGRGIVTEALIAVRDHAIRELGLMRIFALPYAWNPASFRVLEKAGFELEGRLRRSAIKDGKITDQLLYAYVPSGS